jgi:hypothetical protein
MFSSIVSISEEKKDIGKKEGMGRQLFFTN